MWRQCDAAKDMEFSQFDKSPYIYQFISQVYQDDKKK